MRRRCSPASRSRSRSRRIADRTARRVHRAHRSRSRSPGSLGILLTRVASVSESMSLVEFHRDGPFLETPNFWGPALPAAGAGVRTSRGPARGSSPTVRRAATAPSHRRAPTGFRSCWRCKLARSPHRSPGTEIRKGKSGKEHRVSRLRPTAAGDQGARHACRRRRCPHDAWAAPRATPRGRRSSNSGCRRSRSASQPRPFPSRPGRIDCVPRPGRTLGSAASRAAPTGRSSRSSSRAPMRRRSTSTSRSARSGCRRRWSCRRSPSTSSRRRTSAATAGRARRVMADRRAFDRVRHMESRRGRCRARALDGEHERRAREHRGRRQHAGLGDRPVDRAVPARDALSPGVNLTIGENGTAKTVLVQFRAGHATVQQLLDAYACTNTSLDARRPYKAKTTSCRWSSTSSGRPRSPAVSTLV